MNQAIIILQIASNNNLEFKVAEFMGAGKEAKSFVTDSPKKDAAVAQMVSLAKELVQNPSYPKFAATCKVHTDGKLIDLITNMAGQ